MSGTLQLGGTNLAVHSGSGASAKITLDSGLVFPAGKLINYDLQTISSAVSASTPDDTPGIAGSTPVSITLPAGSSAIISAFGGKLNGSIGTTRYNTTALISYTTDGTTPSSSSNFFYGNEVTLVSPAGTSYAAGVVEGKVDNSTGSDLTLKWNWGVIGLSTEPAQWYTSGVPRAHISLKTLIFKN